MTQYQPDWNCPSCGDLQFARNTHCRKCGTPKEGGDPAMAGGGYMAALDGGCGMGYGGPYGGGCGGKGGFPSKPGDWNCTACGDLQFARNTECRRCGAPKPDGMNGQAAMGGPPGGMMGGGGCAIQNRPGDWDCPNCGDHVFAKNNVCRRCGTTKPPGAGQAMSGGQVVSGGGFVLQNRPGDWNCPNCGDHVFAKNSVCRRCGTTKPEGQAQAVTGGPATIGGPGGTFMLQNRPGDWSCPGCGDHVFAKNDTCRRCGTVKPENAPQAALPQQPQPVMMQQQMLAQPVMQQVLTQPAGQLMGGDLVGQQQLMGQQVLVQQPGGQQVVMLQQPQQVVTQQGVQMVVQQVPGQGMVMADGMGGVMQGGLMMQQPMGPAIGQQGGMVLEMRPGDWSCPNCGDHVFARHAVCRKCGTPNPSGAGAATGGMQKPGDWVCQQCGDIVFGRNPACRKCGAAKPEGTLDVFGNPAVGGGGGPPTKMPGDWLCGACGDHQFARNTTCRRCGAARPEGAGGMLPGMGGGLAGAVAMHGGGRDRSRSRDRGGN